MYVKFDKPFYHGTVSEIIHVDVNRGRDRKDFGKGFYIAASRKQAVGMMHKKYREAVRRNRNKKNIDIQEYLYEILLDEGYARTLNIKIFEYNGYNECFNFKYLDQTLNNLYLDVILNDNSVYTIKLNLNKKYSNYHLLPFKIKSI